MPRAGTAARKFAHGLPAHGSGTNQRGRSKHKKPRPRRTRERRHLGPDIWPPWRTKEETRWSSYRAGCVAAGTSAPSFSGAGSSRRHAPRATAATTVAIRMAPFIVNLLNVELAVPLASLPNDRNGHAELQRSRLFTTASAKSNSSDDDGEHDCTLHSIFSYVVLALPPALSERAAWRQAWRPSPR